MAQINILDAPFLIIFLIYFILGYVVIIVV